MINGLLGRILKKKVANYQYASPGKKHRFGIFIDETDPLIFQHIDAIENHPFAKADTKILSFRKKEIPHKYDYSYLKEDLPFSKWPVQKEVENFIAHRFQYFIPLIKNYQSHHEVIGRLVQADIKFADARSQQYIDWNICLDINADNPLEFLNFASQFISNP